MADLTVACVLRSGGDFDATYVYRLRRMVARHLPLPHRFVCLSDVDVPCERIPLKYTWPGWWAKMELFRPDIEAKRMLALDLDTLVVGNIMGFASADRFTMIRSFSAPGRRGSGVMMLTDRAPVWEAWMANPVCRGMEQEFIRPFCEQTWQEILPEQLVSYKVHVRPLGRVPDDARIIAFHGKPRPADLPDDHWLRPLWG